jgi:hypothetical protein
MATRFNQRSASALIAAAVIASALTGCGANGAMPTAANNLAAGNVEAKEATVLKKAFDRIHRAVFTKLDADSNKKIDEYEAGPQLSLKDFGKADKNKNHNLTYSEFKGYAVTNLFLFKDTPNSFLTRFRGDLGKVFSRLDSNRNGLLEKSEVSNADLKKLRLTFEYPRLNIKVAINKAGDAFAAADRTGDGKLGQAEWEDCYIELVVLALGGDASAPAPVDPAPPAEEPVAPPADEPTEF